MPIIVVDGSRKAHRLEREVIAQEDYLQQYIHENPDSLPLGELNASGRLLVLHREFPTAAGRIDALAIDADGAIYVIETKLYRNPDKRRVIAQMLDYGAALWRGGAEAFLAQAGRNGNLETRLTEAFALVEESEVTTIVSSLEANVEAGRFRFVVLMDRMDDSLKDLIAYVNANSKFTVYGVEIDFFRHGDLDILIPRLFGEESRKLNEDTTRASSRRWTEEEFFESAGGTLTPEQLAGVRQLYEWAKARAEVRLGTGTKYGGFNVVFPEVHPRRLFKITAEGAFVIPLSQLGGAANPFRHALDQAGFAISSDAKKPTFSIEEWLPVRDRLMQTIERFVETQRAATRAGRPDQRRADED